MRFIFRLTDTNRYSFIPLFHVFSCSFPDVKFDVYGGRIEDLVVEGKVVIFYSFTTVDIFEVSKEVSFIKNRFPDAILVSGGPHVSAIPRWAFNVGFDSVVIGEGETVFADIITDLLMGDLKRVYYGTRVDYIEYSQKYSPYLAPIEIVRGCPYGCKFCEVSYLFGRVERYRKLESVVEEAKISVERGRNFARFIAPNALSYYSFGKKPNVDILRDLFKRLRDVGIDKIYFGSFPSEIRPDYVDEEVVKVLREFLSNNKIIVGVQSASNELLTKLNRAHSVDDVVRATDILNHYGFNVVMDFLFGLPEETENDLKETVRFIEWVVERYNTEIRIHYFIPLPLTPYAKSSPKKLPNWVTSAIAEIAKSGKVSGYWHKQKEEGIKIWQEIKRYLV
ncbi:MAG: TIGR04013 family B12-binding domain/radical SAM domain-containing protein [Thermosulfidibacteraceae bacterium]